MAHPIVLQTYSEIAALRDSGNPGVCYASVGDAQRIADEEILKRQQDTFPPERIRAGDLEKCASIFGHGYEETITNYIPCKECGRDMGMYDFLYTGCLYHGESFVKHVFTNGIKEGFCVIQVNQKKAVVCSSCGAVNPPTAGAEHTYECKKGGTIPYSCCRDNKSKGQDN